MTPPNEQGISGACGSGRSSGERKTPASAAPSSWPARDAPEGFRAAWVVDTAWRSIGPGSRCRFSSGHPLRFCGEPAVATFQRGKAGRWAYCDEHLYGHRFWNGAVWTERLFAINGAPAA